MPNELPGDLESKANVLPTEEELDQLNHVEVTDQEVDEFLEKIKTENVKFYSLISDLGEEEQRRYLHSTLHDRKKMELEHRFFYQDPPGRSKGQGANELYNPMIYMNPDEAPSPEPTDDAITEAAQKVLAAAIAAKPVAGWRGVHRCSAQCEVHSTATDYFIGNEMVHTMLVHYVRSHRQKCSPALLEWIEKTAAGIQGEPDPIEFQVEWHEKRYADVLKDQPEHGGEKLRQSVRKKTERILRGE
jgi:hypothetical protein